METDADRRAVAESYLRALDAGGVSPTTGLGLFDHFADQAEVYFPKWGIANGRAQVVQMFTDIGGTLRGIRHHYDGFTWYMNGTPRFAVEGTSDGTHRDGPWQADNPMWGAGRWCDCFTVEGGADHAPVHLSRPRLRGQGHGALSVDQGVARVRRLTGG